LTAGTRRNGTSKFGPFTVAPGRPGVLDSQAPGGRGVVAIVGYGEAGHGTRRPSALLRDQRGSAGLDDAIGRPAGPFGYRDADRFGYGGAGPFGNEAPTLQVVQSVCVDRDVDAILADEPAGAGYLGDAGRAGGPGKDARRYAGRHASHRGKTARNKTARNQRAGDKTAGDTAVGNTGAGGKPARKRSARVVPAAAVAATLAAGTAAAYGLTGGGQPQAGDLNASLAVPGAVASAPAAPAGHANGATAAPIGVSTATASGAAYAPKHAKPAPRHAPATPAAAAPHATATASPAAKPAQAPARTQQAPAASAPAASAPATTAKPVTAATLSCNLGYGMLPANVTAIVSFLLANGYTHNAAAGIAGNIYQESKGNPESVGMGGGGLIGWTPLPAGFVTGNVSADLRTQLSALLTYNQGWAQYLPALNAAASPAGAAYIYVTDFERAGIPAAATREASAQNVAGACGI